MLDQLDVWLEQPATIGTYVLAALIILNGALWALVLGR